MGRRAQILSGSIIAAIITIQTPTNQPSAARATRNATRPIRARARRREDLQLRRVHAAQANSEREKADFPS
jgi:hypothetical protein